MATLLNIKKNNNAIKNGTIAKIENLPTGLNGYTLSDENETVSFVYNSTYKKVDYEFSGKALYSTDGYTNKISISSKGFVVYK